MRYVVGAPGGGTTDAVETLFSALAWAELRPEVDEHLRATLWLKLVNNVGLNSVSTLHRVTMRQLLERAPLRAQAKRLMEEALSVGQALGVVEAVDIEARLEYAARLSDVKTSMLQDLEAGRALEIDPILGAVAELADRNGLEVPNIRETYERLADL
jgi:2-dehydropantoate 2-reductase